MNKIKWIAQVIAQSYEIQKSLFPDFANVADELAVEWERALDELDELNITSITDEQRSVIKKLLSISGPANIQYWNNTALCKSVEWQRMREMAIDILSIMHWEKTVPAKPKAIYINQDNVSIMS